MTGVDLSDPLPIHFYERALDGQPIGVQFEDGTYTPLLSDLWSKPRLGDDSVVERCRGATLDVGCGPGRLTHALNLAGVKALGIDISSHAVRLARNRGAAALQQDVFAVAPQLGRWQHVLLIDGNIGISGDATALLERCRELLWPGGSVIVEAGPPGIGSQPLVVRLVCGDRPSHPFRWLISDANAIIAVGSGIGLVTTDEWAVGGRWFVELGLPGVPTVGTAGI